MRVAFAGTPSFAATALEALVASGFEVPLVLTQPDRPGGRRGLRLTPSAVAQAASRLGLATIKPATLREPAAGAALRDVGAHVLVVAAYGLILPPAVLGIPARGCINIHASLLPRWRGAAPIQRAILAGDELTGVTIMQMDAGLDTGAVLLSESHAIAPRDNAGTLTESLARLGARLIVDALSALDQLVARPQATGSVTYATKISKEEAIVDWRDDAIDVDRRVRAFNPFPGAETRYAGEALKLWDVETAPMSGEPGVVAACDRDGIIVGCGTGSVVVRRVQRPGGKPMPAADFARGARLAPGAVFGAGMPSVADVT